MNQLSQPIHDNIQLNLQLLLRSNESIESIESIHPCQYFIGLTSLTGLTIEFKILKEPVELNIELV